MDPINWSLVHQGEIIKTSEVSQDLIAHFHKIAPYYSFLKASHTRPIGVFENPTAESIQGPFELDDRICPIILAGGQSTRLGVQQPKALFPILGKSLIGHFCEKIKRASEFFNKPLMAFVMVSEEGLGPILEHLKEHHYFGLIPSQLRFFTQNNLPLLTLEHKFIQKNAHAFHEGPNGNGEVFALLAQTGLFNDTFSCLGFEIIPIDNPLAPLFSKIHAKAFIEGFDVSIKAISLNDPLLKLGRIGSVQGNLTIIEYSENPPLELTLANTGLLGFSYSFAKKIASIPLLPKHVALKSYPCFENGSMQQRTLQKFETFIFDLIPHADTVKVWKGLQKELFAPLKEPEGPFGKKAVETSLLLAEGYRIG